MARKSPELEFNVEYTLGGRGVLVAVYDSEVFGPLTFMQEGDSLLVAYGEPGPRDGGHYAEDWHGFGPTSGRRRRPSSRRDYLNDPPTFAEEWDEECDGICSAAELRKAVIAALKAGPPEPTHAPVPKRGDDYTKAFAIVKWLIKHEFGASYFSNKRRNTDDAGNPISSHRPQTRFNSPIPAGRRPRSEMYPAEVNWETTSWVEDDRLDRINDEFEHAGLALVAEYDTTVSITIEEA